MKTKTHPTGGGRKPKFNSKTVLIACRVPEDFKDEIKARIYKLIGTYAKKTKQ